MRFGSLAGIAGGLGTIGREVVKVVLIGWRNGTEPERPYLDTGRIRGRELEIDGMMGLLLPVGEVRRIAMDVEAPVGHHQDDLYRTGR